jgi:hypothetical protein
MMEPPKLITISNSYSVAVANSDIIKQPIALNRQDDVISKQLKEELNIYNKVISDKPPPLPTIPPPSEKPKIVAGVITKLSLLADIETKETTTTVKEDDERPALPNSPRPSAFNKPILIKEIHAVEFIDEIDIEKVDWSSPIKASFSNEPKEPIEFRDENETKQEIVKVKAVDRGVKGNFFFTIFYDDLWTNLFSL